MKNENYQTTFYRLRAKKAATQQYNLIFRREIVNYMAYLKIDTGSVYVKRFDGFIRFRDTFFERKVKRTK